MGGLAAAPVCQVAQLDEGVLYCPQVSLPSRPPPGSPRLHPTHPREESTEGEAKGDPWLRKAKRGRSAAGHIRGTAHERHNRAGKNQQHLCVARGWAGEGFQLGPPCCPQLTEGLAGQEGASEVPRESEGQAGAPPGETRVPRITGRPAEPSRGYSVQKGPVSWRLGLRTPWMTTPGAEGKREL